MEKQKCPEIRFSGFDKEWMERSWRDTVEISTNMVDPRNNEYGELFHIGPGNIKSFSGQFYDNVLKVKDSNLISGKFYFRKGDIIYGKINPQLAKYVIAPFEGLASADAYVLNTKNGVIQNYLYAILQTNDFYKYTVSVSSRTGMPKINRDELNIYNYFSPSEAEQTLIGKFLQNLDESIALHEKKLTQTQNFKKAMLEKMFPKQGSKRPEIRLKGFSGDWEPFTLGSLCHIGDIDHRMPESREQGIPYLMTGDFIGINELDFKNAKRISNEDYEQLAKKIKPEAGDILFARYASVGTVRYVKTHLKFLISYSCAILKTSVNSNGEYLFYYLQTKCSQNQIEQEINTGSQRNIGIDSLKKLSILLPKDDEQRAIADFFRKIDENLFLQEKQLQTLKNLKQALLEKMFV